MPKQGLDAVRLPLGQALWQRLEWIIVGTCELLAETE